MPQQKTILVIEDDENLLKNISTVLELYGFTVLKANSGSAGVQQAITNQPNLIICDVMMESMNGFEVIAQIRSNSVTNTIPFIFLTAWADVTDKLKGIQAGAQAYLTKPFVAKDLVNTINTYID
jgi:DNA-binding response OmpR family regulator